MAVKIDPSDVLSKVLVSKPCPANWREMRGDARTRHCTHCSLNVYNISDMSRQEAADLIQRSEGRLCLRYYTRGDGTIITKNCPKGVSAEYQRFGKTAAITAMVFGFLGLSAIIAAGPEESSAKVFFANLYERALEFCGIRRPMMGDVAVISPAPTSTPMTPVALVPVSTSVKKPLGTSP